MTKSILSEQREADERLCRWLDRYAGGAERWRCFADSSILREVAARIRALSEALQEACHERDGLLVPQWQPIETAPRDGTNVLLYATVPPTDMLAMDGPVIMSGYFDSMDDAWCSTLATFFGPFVYPTNWMPLPTPPGEK